MEIKHNDNNFDEFEKYEALSDKDIFTKIWLEPRRIFKYINDKEYEKYFYILVFFAGMVRAFDRASLKNMGDKTSLFVIIASCVLIGGFLGWLSYYIYAALLSWTGKWLGGIGNTSSLYRIIVYAMIPSILSLILLIPEIAIYGNDVFKDNSDLVNSGIVGNIIFWLSIFFEFSLSIVTFVFMMIGVSEVQKFSLGKAFLNLLLPLLVFIVPILLFVMIFSLI
ncbi:Yip1 family protein [Chryseobacterium sp. G0201]|uniref:Yip1 family protein n=1 Tax=Chryseobacterium sp. G0201 TaxID=2487065 RepID=UPI000F515C2A|nr:Yip1 family protein [Chryseobacterium sp. G0201]AZA51971.1 YIP1 family protein [Chryseobacterium sp. G0201]